MIKTSKEALFQLGLEAKEAALYVALLEEGPSAVSKIAHASNIDRTSAYSILGRLSSKGFVGYVIENNVRKYSATDPEKLLDVLEEKKLLLKSFLPSLKALSGLKREEAPRVTVYNGREGFKTVLNDLLRHGNKILGLGYTASGPRLLGSWYAGWQRRRIKLRIWRYYITSRKSALSEAGRSPYTRMKVISEGLAAFSSTLIYGDRIAIFFAVEDSFTGIIIESERMADSYRDFFNALWKKL